VVLLSFWGKTLGFFFVKYVNVSGVFFWYLFCHGYGDALGFYPGFYSGCGNGSLLPVDFWVEGS